MTRSQSNWRNPLNIIVLFVLILWAVQLVNCLSNYSLNTLGILPRQVAGLPGLLLWPFLHGGFQHLAANTLPLLVMGYFVALRGLATFAFSTCFIAVVGGLGVWLFARSAFHIGASGLVFGFFGFLVMLSVYERSFKAILIAGFILFLYGGLIFGILPGREFISWEGHLSGLLAGILAAKISTWKQGL